MLTFVSVMDRKVNRKPVKIKKTWETPLDQVDIYATLHPILGGYIWIIKQNRKTKKKENILMLNHNNIKLEIITEMQPEKKQKQNSTHVTVIDERESKGILKYFKMNENKTCQHLGDAAIAALQGRCIVSNAYIRQDKRSQTNNLSSL